MMTHLLDNPGMMEAKIIMPLPYKTSTPMKPIFSRAADRSRTHSSLSETATGVEDSGYLSCLTEETNTSAIKSDSSYCKDGRKNLSLFESMLQSRNHSINLEQLVEKVNLRKEKKNEMFYNVSTSGRPRSYSASEISSVRGGGRRVALSQDSSTWSNISNSSVVSEAGSPTLDQVLLMGSADKMRLPRLLPSPQLSTSSSDYDISEMLASIKMKEGPLPSPLTPSPDASTYRRNPESLFGLETLQRSLYQPRRESCKPSLASITESEVSECLSSTPREYYSSGLSPGITGYSLSPHSDSPEPLFVCQSSTVTWSGNFPQRLHHNKPRYSAKIFLGGVPWDVTEISLVQAFSQFGQIR